MNNDESRKKKKKERREIQERVCVSEWKLLLCSDIFPIL